MNDSKMRESEHDVSYKVLLLGDSGVGKTAIIRKLMGETFSHQYIYTIGIDFVKRVFDIDGVKIQLQVWDTAGQERFRTITKFHYRGTKGILLVYDITNKESYDMLNYWLESIDQELDKDNAEPVPIFIVGNKCDLKKERVVTKDEGKMIFEKCFAYGFDETSAKEGINVEKVFIDMATAMIEIYNPKMMDSHLSPSEKKEKYDLLATLPACNGNCQCGGLPRIVPHSKSRFKLSPIKSDKVKRKCCTT